ncbi:MAG: hypothetical protein WCK55_18625 [Verrucomicrobiota bacterium]|nr:hypothetical protein [Verrucomicrobiota bacterium]
MKIHPETMQERLNLEARKPGRFDHGAVFPGFLASKFDSSFSFKNP